MNRPCILPGCPHLAGTGSRCEYHRKQAQREREAHRPGTVARGYGSAHQSARRGLAATLPAPCGYCGTVIQPGEEWVAAHVLDGHPECGYVVAHVACNQRAIRRGGGRAKSWPVGPI